MTFLLAHINVLNTVCLPERLPSSLEFQKLITYISPTLITELFKPSSFILMGIETFYRVLFGGLCISDNSLIWIINSSKVSLLQDLNYA